MTSRALVLVLVLLAIFRRSRIEGMETSVSYHATPAVAQRPVRRRQRGGVHRDEGGTAPPLLVLVLLLVLLLLLRRLEEFPGKRRRRPEESVVVVDVRFVVVVVGLDVCGHRLHRDARDRE